MMLLPSAMRSLSFLLLAFLVFGCTQFDSTHPNIPPAPQVASSTYTQSAIDELLTFAANMAKLSESSRAEQCKSLLDTRQKAKNDTVQLHLLVGRLLSEACGDIPQRLEEIKHLKAVYAADTNLQKLIILHEQVLINMHNQSQKLATIEHRRQKTKSNLETKEALESKDNETRLLREKLEAIRSMEKQLDESSPK